MTRYDSGGYRPSFMKKEDKKPKQICAWGLHNMEETTETEDMRTTGDLQTWTIPWVPNKPVNCQYKDICRSYPFKCGSCKNNIRKKDYYEREPWRSPWNPYPHITWRYFCWT